MNRKVVIVVLFVVIVGMAYGIMEFLASKKELPKARKSPEVVRYVKSDFVKYDTINAQINADGRVYSTAIVDLIAEGSGKIITGKIPLKKGQNFKKGDVLLTIYKDEVELALMAKKSGFMRIVANLLPDIKIDYTDNYDQFFQFFNSIDVKKKLPKIPEVTNNQLKLFLASNNILSEYYSILKDEKAVSRYTKYAPFNGTYLEVNFEEGAFTNTGGRIAKMIRTDQVEIEVPVVKTEAKFISVGDKVELIGAESQQGVVIRKAGYIDEGTQAQSIFVKVTKGSKPLPGDYFDVVFDGHEVMGVMEVPRNAVFNSNEVFTIVDGRLSKKQVEVVKFNEKTVLIRGLEQGALMVMQPMIGVSDGVKVSRIEDAPKELPKQGKPGAGKGQNGNGKPAKAQK